ncbi:MAG: hypothetical protein HRT37_01750 [Alteromonadaceae bacterium]|nr:hypothetical protein [Alteromonadaceae bacterium]
MKNKIILGYVLLIFAFSTQAGERSDWGTITEFYVIGDGSAVRIRFSEAIVNPEGCTGTEYYMRELDETSGSNRFFSTLLAAYSSKAQVNIFISGCTSINWWGKTRPHMHEISVKN